MDPQRSRTELMSVAEVAAAIGMHPQSVYQQIREGTCPIPFLRLGHTIKFNRSDVEQIVGKGTPPTKRLSVPTDVLEAFCDFLDEASGALRAHIEGARAEVRQRQQPGSPRNP